MQISSPAVRFVPPHPPNSHNKLQACAQESQLFEQFFPAAAATGGGAPLAPLVDPLCTLLYDAVSCAVLCCACCCTMRCVVLCCSVRCAVQCCCCCHSCHCCCHASCVNWPALRPCSACCCMGQSISMRLHPLPAMLRARSSTCHACPAGAAGSDRRAGLRRPVRAGGHPAPGGGRRGLSLASFAFTH